MKVKGYCFLIRVVQQMVNPNHCFTISWLQFYFRGLPGFVNLCPKQFSRKDGPDEQED